MQQSIAEYLSTFFKGESLLTASSTLSQKMRSDEGFVRKLVQFLGSEPTPIHFHVITMIHPILIQVFPELSKQLQEDIRGGLLNAVVELHSNLKSVAGLALLIRQILEVDGPDAWLQPFGQLLEWVKSDDIAIMEAGIEFFIYLLKETSYTSSNTDLPLYKIAHPLLEALFQIFAQSQLTETMREKLLFLVLQIVKTFSIFDGSKDTIVKQCFDGTYQIWMSLFVSALQSSLHLHLTIKKYIMKILIIIYRDMPRYSEKSLFQSLDTIWEFNYKMMPMYLFCTVWNQPLDKYPGLTNEGPIPNLSPSLYYDEELQSILPPVQGLAHCCIEFLSVITSTPVLSTVSRFSIHHITNTLFHYMLLTNVELRQWENNPTHFITYSANTIQMEALGLRGKVIPIINQLIEKYGDLALQSILIICEKFLMNHPQSHTTELINGFLDQIGPQFMNQLPQNMREKFQNLIRLSSCDIRATLKVSGESWRKVEVALSILSRFAEDIIVFQSKQQASFDIESFVRGLITQIKDQDYYALLKGQSLHCLTRFTEIISIKYKDLFRELLVVSTHCLLPGMPISLKVVGCKALTTFSRKIDKHKLKLSQENIKQLVKNQPGINLSTIDLQTETINPIMEALIQLAKLFSGLKKQGGNNQTLILTLDPAYLLRIFHKYSTHQSTMQLYFNLLNTLCSQESTLKPIHDCFSQFIQECLKAYINVITSEQKKYLKNLDTDLIMIVLKISDILINKVSPSMTCSEELQNKTVKNILPHLCQIINHNDQVQIHVATTICIKNCIRLAHRPIKNTPNSVDKITEVIRSLLKIPSDKTFQSAAIYSGNITILSQALLFQKTNYQILQEAVLKVFRSRTPSVIQSLILIYSRMINLKTEKSNIFDPETWKEKTTEVIDFLASFSIENRMGLKILVDKWLLQQSLFRGKYTKISTFMALSKLFLLRDKRVDNLLVIGFNPSHTQVCNDVNAPLKILATLIRCLENEMGGKSMDDDDDDDGQGMSMMKEQGLEVGLEKFKEEQPAENQGQGGLADRQNQQGSTCYMSAMLEFYDDGQECDETTEEDLLFLKDSSTQFTLNEYLLQFFNHLNEHHQQYFKQCLKGLLKSDIKSLQKFVNVNL